MPVWKVEMSGTCAVPTPEERQHHEIRSRAEALLLEQVEKAIEETNLQVEKAVNDAGLKNMPGYGEYFVAYIHQKLYLRLCKANFDNFEGGKSHIAIAIIKIVRTSQIVTGARRSK
jgi:hypothetical protein